MAQIITQPVIEKAFADGQQQFAVAADAIVTPAAADRAKSLNLTIVRGGNGVTAPAATPAATAPAAPAQNGERWIPPRASAKPQTQKAAAQLCDFDRVQIGHGQIRPGRNRRGGAPQRLLPVRIRY